MSPEPGTRPSSDLGERRLPGGIVLRELASDREYEQCVALQRQTWGSGFAEVVPPVLLRIAQKVGGVAAGAFDAEQQMLGFVYGLSGIREDRRAHWSHMLAVDERARGLGLGRELKLYQRDRLLGLGVELMFWTFDPLVARNANLNLNRLGAWPAEYVRDMYGADTGSELHSGLGTDRFVARWELAAEEVERRLRALEDPVAAPTRERPAVSASPLNVVSESGMPRLEPRAPRERIEYVEIPDDIEEVKRRDREQARCWRSSTRRAIESCFAAGYRAVALDRLAAEGRRWAYRMERRESAVGKETP